MQEGGNSTGSTLRALEVGFVGRFGCRGNEVGEKHYWGSNRDLRIAEFGCARCETQFLSRCVQGCEKMAEFDVLSRR